MTYVIVAILVLGLVPSLGLALWAAIRQEDGPFPSIPPPGDEP